uniref:Uncharacterized protein n=1 Tax=Klebsiella pneumoniae TaxID=573 RepID=A0A6M5ZZX8_KLEPN|nr:hypothetical protein [Klebsiella pneumoniae]
MVFNDLLMSPGCINGKFIELLLHPFFLTSAIERNGSKCCELRFVT